MSEPEQPVDASQQNRKGKGRAVLIEAPSERTPLLGGTSQIPWQIVNDAEDSRRSRRSLRSKLTNIFLVSLSVCVVISVVIALLAWSYAERASGLSPEDLINNDLVFDGPDKLDVINVTSDGGIWVNVRGRIGMDAGDAMGINSDADDNILRRLWKGIGRQSVRTLGTVSVNLSTISIAPEFNPSLILAELNISPMDVPLSVDPPDDNSWLTPVSIPVLMYPTTNTSLITQFIREAWRKGYFGVRADVGSVYVRGGSLNSPTWRTKFHGKLSNIRTSIRMKVPSLPGFPEPGPDTPLPDLSQLVTLRSFRLYSSSSHLNLVAEASVPNPAPSSLRFTSPPLPFTVSIHDINVTSQIGIASIVTAPFSLTHPNITIQLNGTVLPLNTSCFPALSSFLMRYLAGEPNRITIAPSMVPGLSFEADFPGPNPRPRILRNVTIQDMKLKPTGPNGQFLASGTVFARIVLPKGMHVGLNVSHVLPDVMIFDGEVPSDVIVSPGVVDASRNPADPPLPDPLPERAFGHIRPDDWLIATSVRDRTDDGEGSAYAISAKVVDVPLEVLPGRQKQFNHFVSKVIFNAEGAVAGIQGTTAVTAMVQGLPLNNPNDFSNQLDLAGLPFTGSVRINKKSLFMGQVRNLQHIIDDLARRVPL